MISAQQLKGVLELVSGGSDGFVIPSVNFNATPDSYTVSGVPASIALTGTIIPNDGLNLAWTIKDHTSTVVAVGTSLSPAFNIITPPSLVGVYSYSLCVTYENTAGDVFVLVVVDYVTVDAGGLIGQLPLPANNITLPAELVPFVAGLTPITKLDIINDYELVAGNSGRIVIVIPDSYGNVVDISDNAENSVLDEFNVVPDPANNQTIYITDLALTPATYFYKVTFA